MEMKKEINQENLQASLKMLDKMSAEAAKQLREEGEPMDPRAERMDELLGDVEFCNKVVMAPSIEEVQKLFAENGVEFTLEETDEFITWLRAMANMLIENDGELSEELLEAVSGGGWLESLLSGIVGAVIGAMGGLGAGFAVSSPTGPGAIIGAAVGAIAGAITGAIVGAPM